VEGLQAWFTDVIYMEDNATFVNKIIRHRVKHDMVYGNICQFGEKF
jgi:hypothetical protein